MMISGCLWGALLLHPQRQPETQNGTAAARRPMADLMEYDGFSKMAASRQRAIGCKFCKGFSLKTQNDATKNARLIFQQPKAWVWRRNAMQTAKPTAPFQAA